jgi:hypothetical protein
MLWKEVGKAPWWRGGQCRHVQISELLSMEKCDEAVMDFLVATVARMFPAKTEGGLRAGVQRGEEYELADSPWFLPFSVVFYFDHFQMLAFLC